MYCHAGQTRIWRGTMCLDRKSNSTNIDVKP
jgi:hypothetical protein